MHKNRFILLLLPLVWSCASRVSPTGGPKDEDPPIVISSIPENGQRNYKGKTTTLTFNEFVTFKSLKEQLIITPRIDSEYESKIKKRTVIIDFEKPFSDSTTYTLNFRDGVVDITEGLAAKNLQLAFSTGNMLDTLEITGVVVDVLTREPKKGTTVGLYEVGDTLNIFTGPPYYFAKTDDTGFFHFRNIKDGAYRIYAFQDNNKNLICQSATEPYGFLSDPIELDTAYTADTISIAHLNLDTLELLRARPSGKYFNITANKYLVDARLSATNDSILYYQYTDTHAGLTVYNTFPINDSLLVMTTLTDSLGTVANDSVYISFPETTRRPSEYKTVLSEIKGSIIHKSITGSLTVTKPFKTIHLDSIYLKRDTLKIYTPNETFAFEIDSLSNILSFTIPTPQDILDTIRAYRERAKTEKSLSLPKYSVVFPATTFISIESDSSERIEKPVSFSDPTKTGVLLGNVTTNYKSYFIQLLDSKFNVIQEQKNVQRYVFSEVKPGDYFIRILIDTNENGKWDYADFRYNRTAEPVIIYKDNTGTSKTAVRANWELNVDLNF